MVTINGKQVNANGVKLVDYLNENDFDINRIAVEINEFIIPREDCKNVVLKDGDIVELVSFVAGG